MLQQTRPQSENHSAKPGRCASLPRSSLSVAVSTSPVQRYAGTRYAYKVRGAVLLQAVGIGECQILNRYAGKPADRIARGMGSGQIGGLRARTVDNPTGPRIYPAWHGLGATEPSPNVGLGRQDVANVACNPLIKRNCAPTPYRAAATRTTQRQAGRDRGHGDRRTLPVGCQRRDATHRPQTRSRTREAA